MLVVDVGLPFAVLDILFDVLLDPVSVADVLVCEGRLLLEKLFQRLRLAADVQDLLDDCEALGVEPLAAPSEEDQDAFDGLVLHWPVE